MSEELSKAQLNQLRHYIEVRDREGWYYGQKHLFENRQRAIIEWIDKALIKAKK